MSKFQGRFFDAYVALDFHMYFSCCACARVFVSGDEFVAAVDMRLFCRACHELELEHNRIDFIKLNYT